MHFSVAVIFYRRCKRNLQKTPSWALQLKKFSFMQDNKKGQTKWIWNKVVQPGELYPACIYKFAESEYSINIK